jgi:hypothetical protein
MPSHVAYILNVMVVGRNDVISHKFKNQAEAEAALEKITDARQGKTDVDLPWLSMPGDQVQAASIQERTLPGIA